MTACEYWSPPLMYGHSNRTTPEYTRHAVSTRMAARPPSRTTHSGRPNGRAAGGGPAGEAGPGPAAGEPGDPVLEGPAADDAATEDLGAAEPGAGAAAGAAGAGGPLAEVAGSAGPGGGAGQDAPAPRRGARRGVPG